MLSRYTQAQNYLPCALPRQLVALAHSVASSAGRTGFCGPPPTRPLTRAIQRVAYDCVTTLRQHDSCRRVDGTGSRSCRTRDLRVLIPENQSLIARFPYHVTERGAHEQLFPRVSTEQILIKLDTNVPAPRSSYLFNFQH
jgi:hypothetical protein